MADQDRDWNTLGDAPTMGPTPGPRQRLRPGQKLLRRYRVSGELGQGGMGVVYRCEDEVGGITVALKALPPELSHDTVEMEEVRDNFRLVEGLHHPNIAGVKTLDRDALTGDYYLVMECVDGVNLRQYRKGRPDGRLTPAEALPILEQIAAALDFAHSRRIIHRDIKPANVMVGADGTVKVLDFGLAAQVRTSMGRVSRMPHGTSGTGPYMAPEQWEGDVQDAATDQYALAALAYELLSGRCPFENPDTGILREVVLKSAVRPLPGLDEPANAALLRALGKERAARFPTCAAFVAELAQGLATAAPAATAAPPEAPAPAAAGAASSTPPGPTRPVRAGGRRWLWLLILGVVALGLLALGLLGAGAWWWWHGRTSSAPAAGTPTGQAPGTGKTSVSRAVLAAARAATEPTAARRQEERALIRQGARERVREAGRQVTAG